MKSLLEKQIQERNQNVSAGEILVYSDNCNYNRYMVISDQEVLTGDIQIVELNDFDANGEYCNSMRTINLYNLQYGWQLHSRKVV